MGNAQATPGNTEPASQPISITLAEAIRRAQQNEPVFVTALAEQRSATIDRYLTKAAMLPSVTYHNQLLYTQPNGGVINNQSSPVFIANNTVHEYISQASINETLSVKQVADVRAAAAKSARADAELELSRRGLVGAVVNLYYSVQSTDKRQTLFEEALRESQSFTDQTQKREAAREVAHADVVKAQLQQQQRLRDLLDGRVAAEKARLELAVLLFPDPRTPYTTLPPDQLAPMPTREEVNAVASTNNPEVKSALASLQQSDAEVLGAKAAYLPDLALNFTYGIDAPQFAKRGPDGINNLGYSISGTIDIPVWDWFSTQKRIKQSKIRNQAAHVMLTSAQRRLIATLDESYSEAATAREQLDLLDQSVRTATESLRLTNLRYTAGEATALEVVDAQSSLISAQVAQADGMVRYNAALSNLKLLSGNL
nr:TolC family protein [Edaphobacter bradus]